MDPCLIKVNIAGVDRGFCEQQGVADCTDLSAGWPALQDVVNAAPDGATLTLYGRCSGPIRTIGRANLTVQGVLPEGSQACQDGKAPLQQDLRSTVAGGCGSPDASRCELIKVTNATNIKVQYLNIVDFFNSGLQYKCSGSGAAYSNCVARNAEEGIELDKGSGGHVALQYLVRDNAKALEGDIDGGICVHDSPGNRLEANTVVSNREGGILVDYDADGTVVLNNDVRMNAGNGIQVIESDKNSIETNVVQNNSLHGILLGKAPSNAVVGNTVSSNGATASTSTTRIRTKVIANNTVASNTANGIRLRKSDKNIVDGGAISGNGSGTAGEQVVCDRPSAANTGTNEINGVPGVALPARCM